MSQLPGPYQQFKKRYAKVWKAYDKLGAAAAESGPLEAKTRELIKLDMAAATKSESAVQSHAHRALEAGATPADLEQAVMLGVTTLGFPAMMTALTWVHGAIANHTQS